MISDPSPAHGLRGEIRAMLRLAIPVIVVQVGMMFMGVVDTIMVGRVSAEALAAIALGHLYFFAVSIFGMGVLMALDPIIAQAVGARDEPAIARGLQRGLIIAFGLSIFASVLLLFAEPLLRLVRQPADVVPIAGDYAVASILGTFPFLAFIVFRQTLQAMRRLAPIVVTIVFANLANVLLNWLLIFGNLGAPELGAVGSGWASSFARIIMAGSLLALSWPVLRPYLRPWRAESSAPGPLVRMVVLGAPIGIQHQLEMSAFGAVALFMGWMGTAQMAGHQVAINLASLTFMVPLGMAAAAAVLVGHAVGRGDAVEARRAALAALLCGAGFMSLSAVVLLTLPGLLAGIYTDDLAVLAIAVTLIPIAGVFQVFDGIQVVAIGILRGVGDVRIPMVSNVLGFWLIGIPVSIYLGFVAGRGPAGLWWGLVLGLFIVATFLVIRVRIRMGRDLARVIIDDEVHPALPEEDPRAAAVIQ